MYVKHEKMVFILYPQNKIPQNLFRTSNPQKLIPQDMVFLTAHPQKINPALINSIKVV